MSRRKAVDQLGLGVEDGGPDRARLAKHNADFTPQGAAVRCCLALRDELGLDPRAWMDPQAGGGVFGWAGGRVWPGAHRRAIEIREEEMEHLPHNYDEVTVGNYLELEIEPGSVEAMVTNPSFEEALAVADKAIGELVDGGWLALLLRLTWGDSKDVSAWMREHPPWGCIELDGRLSFRTGVNPKTGKPYQEDSVTYRMIVWRKGMGRLTRSRAIDYQRYLKLDRLADHEREWLRVAGSAVRPGTEYKYPEIDDLYPSLLPSALQAPG